jgi:N5-(cytidine 5'-diphosphoramidyl)-L-glutamine hydrolase
MKIVAVSQRIDHYPDRDETRDSLDQRLSTFLLAAGFMPVPLSNRLCNISSKKQYDYEALNTWLVSVKPQAFVISGGNDIGEYIERDITETYLLNHAKAQKIPLLGICRGMQMMAHWAGTELRTVNGHVRTRHKILGEISGEVNSYHRFSLSACPTEFKILARSEDGEIEAISHDTLPWEGWMWHPERESQFHSQDLNRLRGLFS